jgi:hypothetical protein
MLVHIKEEDFWSTELTLSVFMKDAVEKFRISPQKQQEYAIYYFVVGLV